MTTKTSASHPIFVVWLLTELPGRVGLTFAPGKKDTSQCSDVRWDRDVELDLQELVRLGMRVQVCLLQDHELTLLSIDTLLPRAAELGVRVVRFPIVDRDVPREDDAVRDLVDDILAAARAGDDVVIHCRGGLGRAGTIGGCVLKAHGLSDDEVFERLRLRNATKCPDTEAQRAYIRAFAAHR